MVDVVDVVDVLSGTSGTINGPEVNRKSFFYEK